MNGATIAVSEAATTDTPVATVATAGTDAAHPSRLLAAVEAAAPTEGADLAMWGLPADGEHAQANAAISRLTRSASPMRRFAGGIIERSATLAVSLTQHAMRFLGVPYSFGGTSASGFDCSGYVQHVFALLGIHLPRTADAQFFAGHHIAGRMNAGDLVFFQTYEAGPSHVGIYLGNDRFVHASSSHGVTVSSLHERYWAARYLGAKRVI